MGAGPGFLTEKLISEGFSKVLGIDKMSRGFEENLIIQKKYLKKIKPKKNFYFSTIEKLNPKKKFDIILLFSVLEHVKNWENLLLSCNKRLTKKGKIIINCPNYSSFYEPHFGLPIFINKKFTYMLYKQKINLIEKKKNYKGMYKELNFITYKKLIKYFLKNKLEFKFDRNILFEYFNRINKDKLFEKRHPHLSKFVKFIKMFGISKLFFYLPMRFQPILQFEIKNIIE